MLFSVQDSCLSPFRNISLDTISTVRVLIGSSYGYVCVLMQLLRENNLKDTYLETIMIWLKSGSRRNRLKARSQSCNQRKLSGAIIRCFDVLNAHKISWRCLADRLEQSVPLSHKRKLR